MWDLIVSVPDHCLSSYLVSSGMTYFTSDDVTCFIIH